MAVFWSRWSSSLVAFRDSARTDASLRRVGGAMPVRMGSWLAGVARRQPETVRKALLSVESSFFVWVLLQQTGAQYSAAEKTSAWVEMRIALVEAPHVEPARRRIRATRDIVLADRFSRCWRYVSVQSSWTPRYVGVP